MPNILNIETATEVCSVCIASDNNIIFEREEKSGPSHATLLGVFVQEAMNHLRSANLVLDAVAVSCGPGSYTGLRIGVSEAKGICYGLSIPLIAVNTLQIMAWSVIKQKLTDETFLLCPMIDARRMEVYDAIYDFKLNLTQDTSADIIDENSFSQLLSSSRIAFFGNGATKVKDILQNPNCIFLDDIYPKASDMADLAKIAFSNKEFVDVAYFEPYYLKEFVATIPKNKVLPPQK